MTEVSNGTPISTPNRTEEDKFDPIKLEEERKKAEYKKTQFGLSIIFAFAFVIGSIIAFQYVLFWHFGHTCDIPIH